MSDALVLNDIQRTFHQAGNELQVLRGAAVSIAPGETVALVGPSGAGKSTLLHIAGLLERPDGGEVIVNGEACSGLSDDRRTALRRTAIGFIYQFHHLLPEFTALENVVVPQMIAGVSKSAARKRGSELLGMVGLSEREGHRPAKLSGGEQQRVAIARALANSPKVLIADEPTGNLDQETAERVFELLMRLTRETGVSLLVATHNPDLAARMDRTLTLKNGLLEAA
ncbi:MAG: ABC transporter ATP-binding protein [Alphaproteobacteria bacterium]|nr:ABC transporter ATP-binding protein [Alphaproteobacteria bacterium]